MFGQFSAAVDVDRPLFKEPRFEGEIRRNNSDDSETSREFGFV
jgi:hypothetical protein